MTVKEKEKCGESGRGGEGREGWCVPGSTRSLLAPGRLRNSFRTYLLRIQSSRTTRWSVASGLTRPCHQRASLPLALRGRAEGKAAHEGNVVAPIGLGVGVADDAHRLQVLLRPVVDVARARLRDVRPLPRGRRTAVSEPGRSGAGAQHEGGSAARTMPRCTPQQFSQMKIPMLYEAQVGFL